MKAQFLSPKDPWSNIVFFATTKLTWDKSKSVKSAAMWALLYFVQQTVSNECNSRMCAEDWTAPPTATVRYSNIRPRKLLCSYLENVRYLLKKYETNAEIAEYDVTILRKLQPASITFQQFTNNL